MIVRSAIVLLLLLASTAQAHKLAPSLLQLTEQIEGRFDVVWKTPAAVPSGRNLQPVLPTNCSALTQPTILREGTASKSNWQVDCGASVVGQTITVAGIQRSGTAVLIKITWVDGSNVQQLITAQSPQIVVPRRQGLNQTIANYVYVGVAHILLGFDHLLFVLALLLLIANTRQLIITVSMFTVGHSVTLALATLGFIRYPVSLIEFAIAVSIFVLAVELARSESKSADNWLRKRSGLAALGFGLLHGMGFAGALGELGLPQRDLLWALFSFNVGIEIGQILFLLCVVFLISVGLRYANSIRTTSRWATVYVIGSLSAYWSIERAATVLTIGPG